MKIVGGAVLLGGLAVMISKAVEKKDEVSV
jgi:hypothetical protein